MTTDTSAAEAFYSNVIGWQATDAGMGPDRPYTILSMGETIVGGLMPVPPQAAGAPPMWMGYVGVDDVDAYTERVKAAGGEISRAPEDIPNIGRFSVVSDPQGAKFILFKGTTKQQSGADSQYAQGHIGWHELHTADLESAFAFYSSLFGWTKIDDMDMGPMGIYRTFAAGAAPVGGMMTSPPNVPASFWLYYFNVDEIDAGMARVKTAGGQLANGPNEVPGGLWVAQCVDPQGAAFALVAPTR